MKEWRLEQRDIFNTTGGLKMRIILVILTLAVVSGFLFFFMQHHSEMNEVSHRKAIELSDYGMQAIGKQLVSEQGNEIVYTDPRLLKSIQKTEFNNGWYTVAVSVEGDDTLIILKVTSLGHYGSQENIQEKLIKVHKSIDSSTKDTIWLPD